MFLLLTPDNREQYIPHIKSMHKLRHQVFIDELKWPLGAIQSIDGMEFDQFDTTDAYYIIRLNDLGEVDACARLIPTTQPNLLCDVFPDLIQKIEKPCSDDVWEVSRFCAAKNSAPKNIVGQLVAAMLEFGLQVGMKNYVSVSDIRIEPLLRRYGWSPERISEPKNTGTDYAAGEIYPVTPHELANVRAKTSLTTPLLANLAEMQLVKLPSREAA
jgi:N-acyl-L-homoserine lactone synthetase